MKIVLFGAGGQVGTALKTTLAPVGPVVSFTRKDCDLTDSKALNQILNTEKPDIVVNAAAYTAVDQAESEVDLALHLNAAVPAQLAIWCAETGALLVDFSTDYIFDGSKPTPWVETDPRAPLNVYGKTKLAGLTAIEDSGCQYLIFIVTWVYAKEGKNFPNTMRRLAASKTQLTVVADQIGVPTPASWIASQVATCLAQVVVEPEKAGLYNLAPTGSTNWCEFAREVIATALTLGEKLALTPADIHPILSEQYPTPAKRPVNSLLDTRRLQATFGIKPESWDSLYFEVVKTK